MKRSKLGINEIELDKPLEWSIYGANGQLLLRQGSVVSSEDVISKIFQHDPFRNVERILNTTPPVFERKTAVKSDERRNPFNEITRFSTRYKNITKDIEKKDPGVGKKVLRLAEDIQSLVEFDEDACLGAIHLYYDQTYTALQPVYKAILCELTASLQEFTNIERQSLLAAALMSNIGLIEIQDQLNNQVSPLTKHQQQTIKNAPSKAVEMLKDCHVDDTLWLKALIENHERNDGSGYPWGLKSKHIGQFAKILGLADTYVAMITKRAYRKASLAQTALQEVYQMASKQDETIYLNFIRQLGAFPPGTLVKLNNGEVAAVTYRGFGNSIMSSAMSIGNDNGQFYATPIKRDTSLEEFKIMKIFNPKTKPNLNPDRLWSYK
jgi:HD-GYP domain-containing protein (c-di-GMP phosphodiesterase class II)